MSKGLRAEEFGGYDDFLHKKLVNVKTANELHQLTVTKTILSNEYYAARESSETLKYIGNTELLQLRRYQSPGS